MPRCIRGRNNRGPIRTGVSIWNVFGRNGFYNKSNKQGIAIRLQRSTPIRQRPLLYKQDEHRKETLIRTVPRMVHLQFLLILTVWNDRFSNRINIDQVMPRVEIKTEDSLVLLNAQFLRITRGIGSGGLYR
jgi:hypothetical protein